MTKSSLTDFDWTLPAHDYRDPLTFQKERKSIFANNWMLFSWSSRLKEPGDYVTGTVAGYPIYAMRDENGGIRAFHNVCRHRGAQLLVKEEGHCGKLVVCPYHNWSYRRDGLLNKATDFGSDTSFDPEEFGLIEVDADEWRGLVFIRVSRSGARLLEWLGPIDEMASDYPLETQKYFSTKNRDCDVDWKTYGENYLECYHCRTMHPGLCQAMDIENYRVDIHQDKKFFHLHAPKRDGGSTRGLYFYRFPCLMLNFYDWGSSIASVEPLGPGRIRHINWYFFQDVSEERREDNQKSVDWSAQVVSEDLDIITGVQRNLNAGVYERGPLSPKYEASVKAFQDMVVAEMPTSV